MHKQQNVSLIVSMTMTLFGVTACGKQETAAKTPPPPPPPPSAAQLSEADEVGQPADPRFIGRIWVSTTPGHARGTMMIFLPDRSLLMDSCFETYRISKWGAQAERIRWIEDAIPIEATISMPSENELNLQLAGQDKLQSYVTATVPYVCPDMPR
jgi:hypothetical protein